jgi:hypothetical protein
MMLVPISRFLFLEVSGIGQQNAGQIYCSGRRIDGTAEPLSDESRQVTGVVDVRVSQNYGIDRAWIHGRLRPVAETEFLSALKQATVDKDPQTLGLQKEFRSRNGLRRAQEGQLCNDTHETTGLSHKCTSLRNDAPSRFGVMIRQIIPKNRQSLW